MNGQHQHSLICPARYLSGQCNCSYTQPEKPTEMVSLREIKSRLATIEQGQGVICERLDNVLKQQDQDREAISGWIAMLQATCQQRLDEIRGTLLHQQFAANASKPKKRGKK